MIVVQLKIMTRRKGCGWFVGGSCRCICCLCLLFVLVEKESVVPGRFPTVAHCICCLFLLVVPGRFPTVAHCICCLCLLLKKNI